MLTRFKKYLSSLICLPLLISCNTSPINVSGTISLKQEGLYSWEKPYVERDRVLLFVWFCPKEVKLREQVEGLEYVVYIVYKTKDIAEKSCFKAESDIEKLTYSIEKLPSGRYDVSAILFNVNPRDHGSEAMIWFGRVNKSQELNFNISNGQSTHHY
ncbi:hypothetical protein [Planktothrix agardhii]|jgi:hypothetical protein|uniref:hypothetical protein n=1 Tax=Planktothrix agardhii TaxID=1160 RepID=UPI001D0B4A6F|nr:hypothetical protein [Planktothrix agardhii]MCB8751977.1 hypothetical protein [Planktothrix agardhii 1810]MCF3607883.1 hypothetical protein [Planktothrix agardhii 1033]